MNKSKLFTTAHKIAKTLEGDYRARFAYALTQAWEQLKGADNVEKEQKELEPHEVVENFRNLDLKAKHWWNKGVSRVYVDGFHYSKSFYVDFIKKEVVANRPGAISDAEKYCNQINLNWKIR